MRCPWAVEGDALYEAYHDLEWGVPQYEDRLLLETLTLEGQQAGLSWRLILGKRQGYREAFFDFEPQRVSMIDEELVQILAQDRGLVRHVGKIRAVVQNARACCEIQRVHGSLSRFLWDLVGGVPRVGGYASMEEIPACTKLSQDMSRALRGAGFSFVGPKTCYAFMQACGMAMDHLVSCERYAQLARL